MNKSILAVCMIMVMFFGSSLAFAETAHCGRAACACAECACGQACTCPAK